MAMTAWAANVFSSSICFTEKGRASARGDDDGADGMPSRSIGTPEARRESPLARVSHGAPGYSSPRRVA